MLSGSGVKHVLHFHAQSTVLPLAGIPPELVDLNKTVHTVQSPWSRLVWSNYRAITTTPEQLRGSRRQFSYEVVEKRYEYSTPPVSIRVFDLNVRAKTLPTAYSSYGQFNPVMHFGHCIHINAYTSLTNRYSRQLHSVE